MRKESKRMKKTLKKSFAVLFALPLFVLCACARLNSSADKVGNDQGGNIMNAAWTKHPLFLASDKLKEAFFKQGFSIY
jgi:hypothetical protein